MSVSDLLVVCNQLLPEPHAGLLSGILFGTKAALSSALKDTLIATGTIHITALSGMNITIIVTVVYATLSRSLSRQIAAVLSAGIVIGYIAFVGFSASVVRAGIMGVLALGATALGKKQWPIYALGLSVALMLMYHPDWIGDLGFQLSVLATLGIILFGQEKQATLSTDTRLASRIHQVASYLLTIIKSDLRTTLAAQVFTTPLLFFAFHRVSLIAPIANIAIGWVVAPLTVIGSLCLLFGFVWLPLGYPLAWVSWLLLEYVVGALSLLAQVPASSLSW